MKSKLKMVLIFIFSIIITASISVFATTTYYAKDIEYKNNKTVEDALNELYDLNKNNLVLIAAAGHAGTSWDTAAIHQDIITINENNLEYISGKYQIKKAGKYAITVYQRSLVAQSSNPSYKFLVNDVLEETVENEKTNTSKTVITYDKIFSENDTFEVLSKGGGAAGLFEIIVTYGGN